ncbi:HIR1_6 [Sanghuangporus weigelae]
MNVQYQSRRPREHRRGRLLQRTHLPVLSAAFVTFSICSVVAPVADDCPISAWQTKSARPIIVAKATSSDGTLAALAFDQDELEGIAPLAAQRQYPSKSSFSLPPMPNGSSHSAAQPTLIRTCGAFAISEQVTQLAAQWAPKIRGRDHTQPTFVSSLGTAGVLSASTTGISSTSLSVPTQLLPQPQPAKIQTSVAPVSFFPPPLVSTSVSSTSSGFDISGGSYDGMDVENKNKNKSDMVVPISALDMRGWHDRDDIITVSFSDEAGKLPKARTPGGDRARDQGVKEVREIRRTGVGTLGLRNIGVPSSGNFAPETGYGGLSAPI